MRMPVPDYALMPLFNSSLMPVFYCGLMPVPDLTLMHSGALAMTHAEGNDSYSDSDAWFIYKFEKQQVRYDSG